MKHQTFEERAVRISLSLAFVFALGITSPDAARSEDEVALPECGQAGAPALSAAPFLFHEDSSIQTRIDLGALNPADYLSLGVIVAKENGVDYVPARRASAWVPRSES
jgi:hypothetical protein